MNKSQIQVFDKDDNWIATFDNDNSAHSQESMLDLLADTRIEQEMNGISTLTFTVLVGNRKWQHVNNPTYRWKCSDKVYTLINSTNIVRSENTITVTLHEDWGLLSKEFGQIHNVDTDIEALDIHTVKVLPKTDYEFRMTVNGNEYLDSFIFDITGELLPRGSAGYALWGIIKANRQGWKIGIVDVIAEDFEPDLDIGTFNLESDKMSLLDNMYAIRDLWGGVLIFDSKNKLIHLRDESKVDSDFNAFKGVSFYQGINMLTVPQMLTDNNIITRAYVLGAGDIHIKEVNGGKEYLDNFSYTDEIFEGYIYNENIHYTGASLSGQTELKEWGEKQLAKLCKPRHTFEFDVWDRSFMQEFQHESFDLHDVVEMHFKDPNTNEDVILRQRIIKIAYNPFNPKDVTVTVGDIKLNVRDIYKLYYRSVETNPQPDDNGNLNGNDIWIDLDNEMSEELANGATRTTITNIVSGEFELIVKYRQEMRDGFTESEASISAVANDLEAHISLYTQFVQQTENNFLESSASIDAVANDLEAQIRLEAQHYNQLNNLIIDAYAKIQIVASDLEAQILLEAVHYRELQGEISETSARIEIVADSIDPAIRAEVESAFGNGFLEITDDSASMGASSGSNKSKVYITSSSIRLIGDGGEISLSSQYEININSSREIIIDAGDNLDLKALDHVNIDARKDINIEAEDTIRIYSPTEVRIGSSAEGLFIQNRQVSWETVLIGETTYRVLTS